MKKKKKKRREAKYLALIIIIAQAVFMVGVFGNYMAIVGNDCKMPVLSSYNYDSDEHFSYQDKEEVNYHIFTDIIPIKNYLASIGDLLMIGSIATMITSLFYYGCLKPR